MECFEVRHEQNHLWSVSSNGQVLHSYLCEKGALKTALMLASDRTRSGHQASVTISPAPVPSSSHSHARQLRFSGM
jgi:hypothetical protein